MGFWSYLITVIALSIILVASIVINIIVAMLNALVTKVI